MSQILSLRDVASQIDACNDLEATLKCLIAATCRHAGWAMGSIMAIDAQGGYAQVLARHDPTLIAAQLADRWALASSPTLVALRRNEPVHIRDAHFADAYPGYRQDARDRDYRTVLVLPMNCKDALDRPMVLTVISRQVKEVAEADLAFLGTIIHLGSIAVERTHRQAVQMRVTEGLRQALARQTQLLDHLLGEGSLGVLAERVGALFPDPVLVVDLGDKRIIAGRSPDPALFSDEDWQIAIVTRHSRPILRAAQEGLSGPFALRLSDPGREIVLPAHIEPLFVGAQLSGALILFPAEGRAGATDLPLLESARLALSLQLMHNHVLARSETHVLSDLFRDLVEGRWKALADIQKRAHHTGLNLLEDQQMIVLDFAGHAGTQGARLTEFKRIVMRVSPPDAAAAVIVALDDRIACLLPADTEFRRNRIRSFAEILAAELGRTIEKPPVVVLGGLCRAPEDYAVTWKRCDRLIGIARTFGLNGVLMASGSGPLEMLVAALEAGELRSYIDQSIGPIARYDLEHGTAYLDTLAAFLREGCRAQPCADAMGLHVSTLRYRLARLSELFGVEIDSPEKRFDLELAIRLQMITRSE